MNELTFKSLDKVSPALVRAIGRHGWTVDVRREPQQACYYGDADFAMIRFRNDYPLGEISAMATAINNAPVVLGLLRLLVDEGECYCCSDGVAAKGPCGWCMAKSFIGDKTLAG